MYCKECGHQIADDSKFCANCGKSQNSIDVSIADEEIENLKQIVTQIQTQRVEQKNIFEDLEPRKKDGFSSSTQLQPKSQAIAFILCFFCGLFGFHRFYVGKIGTGILMLLIGPIVIFGMYVKDMAEMAAILETGQKLSEGGDTIVTISAFLGLFLCIWVLIDLIRILTGSFTKVSNSNKGSGIGILAIIVLFFVGIFVFVQIKEIWKVAKAQREQQLQIAIEREQRAVDSLIRAREDSIKKQARNSKKKPSLRLTPEQPQEVLKVQRASGRERKVEDL